MSDHSRKDFLKLMMGIGASVATIPNGLFGTSKKGDRTDQSPASNTAIPTGFQAVDNLSPLLVTGGLTIVAGQPSMGKTSFLLSLASRMTLVGKKSIAYFSLEATSQRVTIRLLSYSSGIPTSRINKGQLTENDWRHLIDSSDFLATTSIFFCDEADVGPRDIPGIVSSVKGGIDIVIIDYFNLFNFTAQSGSRAEQLDALTLGLKDAAAKLNLPIIVAAQLDRSVDHQDCKRPKLGSSSMTEPMERNADIYCSLFREAYYDKSAKNDSIELAILKSKFGATGTVKLGWESTLGKVYNPTS